ncbi:MAG: SDR family oxidoreductase [Isosphaeraceae bacterium]
MTPRVALITGSGRKRVGRRIADFLAERGYGIALHYRTAREEAEAAAEEFRAQGADAIAVGADLADESQVGRLVSGVLHHFGRIDVLVNAASIWERKPLERVTAEDVRRHFDANVLATFLVSRLVGLAMVELPEGGVILNVGDWAEVRPYPNYPAYFATKGAIPTLTRMLAVELGARNPAIRVNALLPGPVMLPDDLPEAERREAIDATLVRREGSPDNVARAALALIDNDFITGICLPIDGGRSIYAPPA